MRGRGGVKTCGRCHRALPLSEFRKCQRKDGGTWVKFDCNACHRAYNRSLRERAAAKKGTKCPTRDEMRQEKAARECARLTRWVLVLQAQAEARWQKAHAGRLTCIRCNLEKSRREFRACELREGRAVCAQCARASANKMYATNSNYHAAVKAKKLRRKRALVGAFVERVNYERVANRDGWRCGICGKTVTRRTWSLDHIVPVSLGGSHSYANVVLAHRTCNSARGTGRRAVQAPLFARLETT